MSGRSLVGGSQAEPLDFETCKTCFEDIAARLKLGKLTEAEADAARLALVARLRPGTWNIGRTLPSLSPTLMAAAAAFLVVSGVGVATSYGRHASQATGSVDATSASTADGEVLALKDYARAAVNDDTVSSAAVRKKLPDVSTMIDRLAARLETSPQDLDGWTMLGRSYFHTARYDQAARAFAKAVELDPNSAELKQAYEEAKTKASGAASPGTAMSTPTAAVDEIHGKVSPSSAAPPLEQQTAIRSMVDGLAARLESSPRDVEGWTHLMRSRVVLGEKQVAATALRKALEVFAGDSAASSQLTAAAADLGLKPTD